MFQEILQTILTSVIARVTANISSLYIAIGATIAVLVCSYFLYKRFFTTKSVEKTVTFSEETVEPQQDSEPTQPVSREEAFAAAMQAEQEAVEQALQKRNQMESEDQPEQTEGSELIE